MIGIFYQSIEKINNKTFSINFENIIIIDYKDDYSIELLATDSDMTEIKKKRQKYLRKKEHNKFNLNEM